MRVLLFLLCILAMGPSGMGEVMLLPRGSTWKYYYNGVVPTNWIQRNFDDRTWPSGPAQIGWGEGDERTVAIDDPGFDPTLYFRKSFTAIGAPYETLTLRLVADDGAVIYLNGVEVLRRNMPSGAVNFSTFANVNVVSNENKFVQYGIPPSYLQPGTNSIAVELHQHAAGGQDASFDLELIANITPTPPEVTIISPLDRTIIAGGDLVVQVSATDADGHIAGVLLSTNGVLLGSLSDPFTFVWHNPPPGRHAILATAVDNLNVTTDSPLVHVQVGQEVSPIQLKRGPYLQMGTPHSMTVRWRTDWPVDTLFRYGADPEALQYTITNDAILSEHLITLSGLTPDTVYYYLVGSSEGVLASGVDYHFKTSPTNDRPIRIWVIGDSGTANQWASAVRDSYGSLSAGTHTDIWLMLGDNAYGAGLEWEFQQAVFEMYPERLRNTVLWPALGNHDAAESTIATAGPYLRAFTFPKNGEAGGVPSGSPLYYSFDYGNLHAVCLDSFLSDRSSNGPMLTWLKSDLETTEKDWIIAYWHHPPYSWGSHVSDTDEREMADMRTRVLPILEVYGVDLVMTGHSHVYERSFLLNGHYGYSWELQPEMILDKSLGQNSDTGPYQKPAGGMGNRKGTVYAVCGCSGEGGWGGFALHPAMATNYGGFGSMVLDVNGLRLDARFVRETGEIQDYFSIDKSTPVTNGPALKIVRQTDGVVLEWPTSKPKFALGAKLRVDGGPWERTTNILTSTGRKNQMRVDLSHTNRFFRLESEE